MGYLFISTFTTSAVKIKAKFATLSREKLLFTTLVASKYLFRHNTAIITRFASFQYYFYITSTYDKLSKINDNFNDDSDYTNQNMAL